MKALEILKQLSDEVLKRSILNSLDNGIPSFITVECSNKNIRMLKEAIAELEALENKFKKEQENNLSSEIAKTETILGLKKYIEALENRSCESCNTYYMKCNIFNAYWKKSETSLIIDSSSFYCTKYEPKQ